MRKITIFTVLLALAAMASGSTTTNKFASRIHTTSDGSLPYRLFIPKNLNPQTKYPIVLTLHGAGERGTDNTYQITKNRLAEVWAEDSTQNKQPCFVVSPQCPSNRKWVEVTNWTDIYYKTSAIPISIPLKIVLDMLDSLKREFPIDTNRIYVTGLSMGGYGTWDLITRFPGMFAAAAPMSGGCDTSKHTDIKKMPIWAFHGAVDPTVPPGGTRAMIAALKNKDAVPVIQYTALYSNYFSNSSITRASLKSSIESGAKVIFTEYTDGNHDIWSQSYNDPLLAEWMFLQKKPSSVAIETRGEIQPNPSIKYDRFLLPSIEADNAILMRMAPGAVYNLQLFEISGKLIGRATVKSSADLANLFQKFRQKNFGINLVELIRLSP